MEFACGANRLVWNSSHQAVPHSLHSCITKNHLHPVNQLRVRWKWSVGSISHWSTNQAKAYMQYRKCECFSVRCSDILHVLKQKWTISTRGNLSLSCWTYELVTVWKQNAYYLFLKVVAQFLLQNMSSNSAANGTQCFHRICFKLNFHHSALYD